MLGALALAALPAPSRAESPTPGGFVEPVTATAVRPRVSSPLPARGRFTFPPPYNTTGARLTNADDCGGGDCVQYVGYSYWRNTNNHVGSDTMLIFLTLSKEAGGAGPTLFSYDKSTDQVTVLGPLFDASHPLSWASGEGWYWSDTQPTKLYVNEGAKLERYDVQSRSLETVFDASAKFGADKYIWQIHSSADDRVHSATLRTNSTYAALGCLVYDERTREYGYFPAQGDFDECQVDKSGRWLLIKQNVDGQAGEDNVLVDLQGGGQSLLLDQAGAAGHSDTGHGYMVAADNWNTLPGAIRLWSFGPGFPAAVAGSPDQGMLVYRSVDWSTDLNHVSHTNARPGVPASQQYACGSGASRVERPRANEVVCFPLDGSMRALVVAPVMTDLDRPGGSGGDYGKLPKGNLDVTGRYFIWTSNAAGRLDAFVVKVPAELLGITPDAGGGGTVVVDAAPSLAAAVLPGSRSVQVGQLATALATVINTGSGVGTGCAISPVTSIPGRFAFQATDPLTNAPVGTEGASVTIQPGAAQTFVIGVTPDLPMPTTEIGLTFRCATGSAAPSRSGLNTLLLSAWPTPVPDLLALTATGSGDGIVSIPGVSGAEAFAVAAANVGSGGLITVSADAAARPLSLTLCQTNRVTGQCESAVSPSLTTFIAGGEMPSFGVFVQAHGAVPFDPANGRIVVRFTDDGGVLRGETSVAVTTK